MAKGQLYDHRWEKARAVFLRRHPLCSECMKHGTVTPATVVDHITPHHGNMELYWDQSNWQPLCASCHSGVKRIADKHGYSQAANRDGTPMDANHPWNKKRTRLNAKKVPVN